MNRFLLKLAMSMVVAGLFCSTPAAAQVAPTTKKAANVKITQGPGIERADSYLTIVRWTINNPGGSPEHYGVVHYGMNPKDLPNSEISNQAEPWPSRHGFPRAHTRPPAWDNLLL